MIGLGRFGSALAKALTQQGMSVLAIDNHSERVESVASFVDMAVTGDTTDEQVLDDLHIQRMTTVIVAIGAESREASILTTALLRQRGVPRIIARAVSDLHRRVLQAVGAHEILNPENEMGRRLAVRLSNPSIIDRLELGDNAEIAEVEAPEAFVGKTLMALDIRNRYHVSVVAIRRKEGLIANPRATEEIASGDMLLLLGTPTEIRRVAALA